MSKNLSNINNFYCFNKKNLNNTINFLFNNIEKAKNDNLNLKIDKNNQILSLLSINEINSLKKKFNEINIWLEDKSNKINETYYNFNNDFKLYYNNSCIKDKIIILRLIWYLKILLYFINKIDIINKLFFKKIKKNYQFENKKNFFIKKNQNILKYTEVLNKSFSFQNDLAKNIFMKKKMEEKIKEENEKEKKWIKKLDKEKKLTEKINKYKNKKYVGNFKFFLKDYGFFIEEKKKKDVFFYKDDFKKLDIFNLIIKYKEKTITHAEYNELFKKKIQYKKFYYINKKNNKITKKAVPINN